MKKIELEIVALSHSITQSNNYAVVLGEKSGNRRLPIVIGAFEAQAIAVAMERMQPNRPLTHDLFKNTFETFEVELREIVINNLLEGVFYARLVCFKDGQVIEIDSRPSDALALAVRFSCPIFTYEFILDAAGVVLEEPEEASKAENNPEPRTKKAKAAKAVGLSGYSEEDLERMLGEMLAEENYEKAAEIRDELNKRKQAEG